MKPDKVVIVPVEKVLVLVEYPNSSSFSGK